MTRTFLVEVTLPDDGSALDLSAIAMDIEEACIKEGIDVDSVRPWQAHSQPSTLPTVFPPTTEPPIVG